MAGSRLTITFTKGSATRNDSAITGTISDSTSSGCDVSQQIKRMLEIHMPNMR